MNAADFDELSESEQQHFYKCVQCGEMVDMRQLDDLVFHETDHKPRPDNSIRRLNRNGRMISTSQLPNNEANGPTSK